MYIYPSVSFSLHNPYNIGKPPEKDITVCEERRGGPKFYFLGLYLRIEDGIIIKARNPHKLPNGGVAFLIGGFGTLGTEAAGYYFRTRFKELGKRFGKKNFQNPFFM